MADWGRSVMGKRTKQTPALSAMLLGATLAGLMGTALAACTRTIHEPPAPTASTRTEVQGHEREESQTRPEATPTRPGPPSVGTQNARPGATPTPPAAVPTTTSGETVGASPTFPEASPTTQLGWDINEQSDKAQREGRIAFIVPTAGTVGVTVQVDVQITADRTVRLETGRVAPSSTRSEAPLPVGPRMKASLSGAAFKINELTPPIKALTQSGVAHWAWDVTPTEEGQKNLLLAAWTVLPNGDALNELDFQRTLTVAVAPATNDQSTLAAIGSWIADNIVASVAAIAALIGVGAFSWIKPLRRSLIRQLRRLRSGRHAIINRPEAHTDSASADDNIDAKALAVADQGQPKKEGRGTGE